MKKIIVRDAYSGLLKEVLVPKIRENKVGRSVAYKGYKKFIVLLEKEDSRNDLGYDVWEEMNT